MKLGRGGTQTHRPMDTTRVGQALKQPGIDPRHWVSYGTVCTVGATGDFDFEDPSAVYNSPDGCYVDVLLHPAMQHVTARYSGVQGGASGTIYTPIKPGDEVLVVIPDGDLRNPPAIVHIMSAEHSRLPMGGDRKPLWQNDRILVHGNGVPVEVRTSDGSYVKVDTDGKVYLNGTAERAMLGDTYTTAESQMYTAWIAAMQSAAGACHAATNPATTMAAVQAVGGMLDILVERLQSFVQGTYLSEKVKLE